MAYTLNPQQEVILDWAKNGKGSAVIEALAGTGKTFTLEQMAAVISGRSLFCAFNKSIAEELKSRLVSYPHCEAATLHSVGLRLFRKLRGNFEIESGKVKYIVKRHLQYERKAAEIVVNAVNAAKQMGMGIPTYPHWDSFEAWVNIFEEEELMSELPLELPVNRAIDICKAVYQESMDQCQAKVACIDFNDMILAPLVMGGIGSWMEMYDWVLVDECQDLSDIRRLLSMRVLKRGGRYVGVGDRFQSIYLFAGATSNSMDVIQKATNAVVLPLSVTYRCPKTVVELAQQWVPHYEAAEGNIDGVVRTIDHREFWKETFDDANDVILCRNTRPLVGIAKRLRKDSIPCIVEGYSPKGLIALAEKWGDINIRGLEDRIREYREAEVTKLENKGKAEKAEKFAEKCNVVLELCTDLDGDDPVKRLVKLIERLFGEGQYEGAKRNETPILRLCTVHRSKGREWKRVFLIGRNEYMPSYWATKSGDPEALKQEVNLEYVAVTRAKAELVEVMVPPKRKKGSDEPEWWEV